MACKGCVCADCVRNPHYAINTPHPCECADCDICENGDMEACACNQYLSIEEVNEMVEAMQEHCWDERHTPSMFELNP